MKNRCWLPYGRCDADASEHTIDLKSINLEWQVGSGNTDLQSQCPSRHLPFLLGCYLASVSRAVSYIIDTCICRKVALQLSRIRMES